jgi:hypothetical protein
MRGTTHIMKRSRKVGAGRSYLLRKGMAAKFPGLFCGAAIPATQDDPRAALMSWAPWHHKIEPWVNAQGTEFVPCPTCVAKRDDYKDWWDTRGPGARRRAKR